MATISDRPRAGVRRAGIGRAGVGWSDAAATPTVIRLFALTLSVAILAWTALLAFDVSGQRTGLTTIGKRNAPVVLASADLYNALNDMDAQLANVLLVGKATDLGFTRGQALSIYEQRREQADQDIQKVAAAAQDPATQRSIRELLDGIGEYETRAAQTILLDEQANHEPGKPSPAALEAYRGATDLLKATPIPVAQTLIRQNAASLDQTYAAQRSSILSDRTRLLLGGALILVTLIALQVYLARRFHRMLNPALVVATALTLVMVVLSVTFHTAQAEHLRVAKKDAFDSVLALSQARAVGYDMNADESRYLVDSRRAAAYQLTFVAKSQSLLQLPGATLATYDQKLAAALRGYAANPADIGWGGFLGTEFRNITFPGEHSAAEETVRRYQTYQSDDREIRHLVGSGESRQAIAFCTSYHPGDSNDAFTRYDTALAQLIGINQRAFDDAISRSERQLSGMPTLPAGVSLVLIVLLLAGIRPRLSEYRE